MPPSCPRNPQIVAANVPPEDQDGSGDDSDNFSGSGAGALQGFTVSQTTSFTWKDLGLLTVMPTAPEPTGADTMAASTSILPAGAGDQERDTVLLAHLEPGFPDREKTTHPPSETTPHPTTHRASTTRATTAQAPVTLHPLRDMQPDHHKTSTPEGRGPLDPHTADPHTANPHTTVTEERDPWVTERTAEAGTVTQFPKGEGSGEEDFTFDVSTEGTTWSPEEREELKEPPVGRGAAGASQGLLDRKDVLGGVIAGGLVGLICAVCLVGFMLYRMKKKDEGSYSLEEPKQANGGAYQKPSKQEEFYA
ncbi:syndecan-1 isoform X2 [Myotis myotis]|uniref:Syndecan n=1 Tax=Myotis myotis TaxID=51298 RepID=A0A7J7U6L5_MYOMY|nr:syndecan-1 isoform X2 [Myotis myotis]KAF6308426.1 syndecan 1 [Myotis myotis]